MGVLTTRGIQVLEDYGPFAVGIAPEGFDAVAASAASDVAQVMVQVNLKAHRLALAGFDVDASTNGAAAPPLAPAELMISDYPKGTGLYVVQFHGPIIKTWLDSLQVAGVRPLQYVNANAYIVAAPAGLSLLRATLSAPVRYVGVLQPAYKMSEGLRARMTGPLLQVQILLDAGQDLTSVRPLLRSIDPRVAFTPVRQGEMQASLFASASVRSELARWPEVLWIEEYTPPSPSDERADQVSAGNVSSGQPTAPGYATWLSEKGLSDLSSEMVDVLDTGLQVDSFGVDGCVSGTSVSGGHSDLNNASNQSRLKYACPAPTCGSRNIKDGSYHGTFVTGLIVGNPIQQGGTHDPNNQNAVGYADAAGFHFGLGVAPTAAFGYTKIMSDGGDFCGSPDWVSISAHAYDARALNQNVFQNNSWNEKTNTTYSLTARTYDAIVRDAHNEGASNPMTVVFSAGNIAGGVTYIQSPATAKNVISVGSSGLARGSAYGGSLGGNCDNSLAIDDVTAFSARHVSNSNRIKPDLMAPGRTLTSAFSVYDVSQSDCTLTATPLDNTNGKYYAATGTSFSAPLVTGAAMLVHRRVWNLSSGNVSAAPSLIKAALIGGAEPMFGGWDSGAGQAVGWPPFGGPGWGRLDLARLFDDTPKIWGNEHPARVFTTSGTYENFTFSVSDPSKPVTVTLVWSDVPGAAGSTWPLVNQLNLWVMQGSSIYCDGQYTG
jgi:hypothetical protein